jgi:hypothetical protein
MKSYEFTKKFIIFIFIADVYIIEYVLFVTMYVLHITDKFSGMTLDDRLFCFMSAAIIGKLIEMLLKEMNVRRK